MDSAALGRHDDDCQSSQCVRASLVLSGLGGNRMTQSIVGSVAALIALVFARRLLVRRQAARANCLTGDRFRLPAFLGICVDNTEPAHQYGIDGSTTDLRGVRSLT